MALLCAMIAAIFVLEVARGPNDESLLEDLAYTAGVVVVGVIGFLLARRVPASPIGWLLLAEAAVVALSGIAFNYADYALGEPGSHPDARLAAVWDTHGWPLIFAPLVAIVYVFPDGRLPGARWRPVAVGGVAAFVVTTVAGVLGSEPLDPPFTAVEPYGILSTEVSGTLQGLGLLGMIATLVLAVVAVRSRFRRGKDVERSQLKWLLYASSLVPVAIICGTIDGLVLDGDGSGALTTIPFVAAAVAIPIAIGIAVTRYRLYEIDRLISATFLYVLLTTLLAATFVAIVLLGGVAIGGSSPLTTALATLAVTFAFRPLRARIQTHVDRRFNRARYEALHGVDAFLRDLRTG
ncbi:MAG: hypothetical protein M3355_02715, partial [Actinomycetota bacterium]|nr:hypothetical protein [Actinomycetota bacterium]